MDKIPEIWHLLAAAPSKVEMTAEAGTRGVDEVTETVADVNGGSTFGVASV